ncbi:type II toxin-antitoxin system RelE/ParE family toxin [bacterium]|nr:MAG: type II toxin-antitoxin system RelE/ParE family toxin [bacterium]
MKKNIEITSEAYSDINDAISFYEKAEKGAGKYFFDHIFNEIDELTLSCGFHPIIFDYFRYTCKKFPFFIYYTTDEKTIIIHAVLSWKKNPMSHKKRFLTE